MTFSRYLSVGSQPPTVPGGVYLPPMFSIVVPIERTNLLFDPSGESTTVFVWSALTGSTRSQDSTDSYKGQMCEKAVPSAGGKTFGLSTTVTGMTAGNFYAVTAYVKGEPGVRYKIHMSTSATTGVEDRGQPRGFVGKGYWERTPTLIYKSAITETISLVVKQDNMPNQKALRVDCAQVEKCETGNWFATTYIDGDQQGLVPNERPIPYFWNTAPHGGSSTRVGTTRAGGRVRNLSEYGFQLLGIQGLGSSPRDVQTTQHTEIDGEELTRIRKEERNFSLIGRFDEETMRRLRSRQGGLAVVLDRDMRDLEQPLKILFQPMDECGRPTGQENEIICTYTGGLEGAINNFNTDVVTLNFRMHQPGIMAVQERGLTFSDEAWDSSGRMIKRTPTGVWSVLASGVNAEIRCILIHPVNGMIFVGGLFTTAGATSADFCAIYNPNNNLWSNINGSDTTFNNTVYALGLAEDGSGDVYIGGAFINAAGNANADGICRVDANGGSLTNIGVGVTGGDVRAILTMFSIRTTIVGGTFTQAGGIANTNSIAALIPTTLWIAVGTGATTGNGVLALAGRGQRFFAGGTFTGMGGVANTTRLASYNWGTPSGWTAMGTGANNTVNTLEMHPKTMDVYIGGIFATLGGITINCVGKWNGFRYEPLGGGDVFNAGTGQTVTVLKFDQYGRLWAGGEFTNLYPTAIDFTNRLAIFTGSTWIQSPYGANNDVPNAIVFGPDGSVYIGLKTGGNTDDIPQDLTLEYTGTARTYPRFNIPIAVISTALYRLENITTGRVISMNAPAVLNDIMSFNFDPRRPKASTKFRGDISGDILPGSQSALMYLQPGTNILNFMIFRANVFPGSPVIYWQNAYDSIDSIWPNPLAGI